MENRKMDKKLFAKPDAIIIEFNDDEVLTNGISGINDSQIPYDDDED